MAVCFFKGIIVIPKILIDKGRDLLKYLFQFTIIGVITAIGELLNLLLPLPVPASIYGLVLLFVLLCTRVIRLEQVENAADFFLTIMPILFVPPTVKLMGYWDVLKDNVIGLVITCVVSTLLVMGITGAIAQLIMKLSSARHGADHDTTNNGGQKHE